MKVLIALTDQSFLRTKSMGIFNISMGLTRGLMNSPEITELHILGNNECREAFADVPPHVHLHLLDMPVPRRFKRVWWDQFGLSAAIRRIAPDWAILPKGFAPFFPNLGKTKLACYVHDTSWEYFGKLPAAQRKGAFPWYELPYFITLSLRTMRKSALVLTHSAFNVGRIHHYVPTAHVARIGIGFDDEPPAHISMDGKLDILTYASPYPHKCTRETVDYIQAWLDQRADACNIRVHIVGSLPESLALPSKNWVFYNRMPYPELMHLLRTKCRMAVYISKYESFGMPPVECLLNGVPCIASDFPSIRENIPAQYIFNLNSKPDFICTANETYDELNPFCCPAYPTWNEVAQRCVQAMQNH